MNEDIKSLIQEWFANCLSNVEIAELYAELLCEIRTQLAFCITEENEKAKQQT